MDFLTKLDPKSKIRAAAFDLFGRFGFEGTSVRDIASRADVNLAALNYHFGSKENLYWDIMKEIFLDLESKIRNFSENSRDTKELVGLTFEYMNSQQLSVANTMKMMLSQGIALPESSEFKEVINNPMGPPGGQYFIQKIEQEVGYPLSRKAQLWGVKTVFGALFHFSIVLTSDHLCGNIHGDELFSPEQFTEDLGWIVESTIEYLKKNGAKFQQP